MKEYSFKIEGIPALMIIGSGIFLMGAGLLNIVTAGIRLVTYFTT